MKTSTHDLIVGIPTPVVPLVSMMVVGDRLDRKELAERLSDEGYLAGTVSSLPERLSELLLSLHEAGGVAEEDMLARVMGYDADELKSSLEQLGRRGLVFQSGLSGREPLLILPSLWPVMEALRSSRCRDPGTLEWEAVRSDGLWPHLTLINAVATFRIRCKGGLEPFKKGWELLEAKLSHAMDLRRVYAELVELGCLREKDGFLVPVQRHVVSLAMGGALRYRVWRYYRSCRGRPGLDYKVFLAMGDRALQRDHLLRVVLLHVFAMERSLPDSERSEIEALVDEWTGAGILEQDVSGAWLRFAPDVFEALRTGRAETPARFYSDEAIVQPTMEILVPRDFDPVDLVNVGEVADLVHADVVSIYRVTKDSVARAVQAGWDQDKIVRFLERISRHSIPEALRMNVAGWCRLHAEAHLIRGTFLVFGGDKAVLPRGLDEVLPGIFRVPRNCEEEIGAFLARKGVVLRDVDAEAEHDHEFDWGRTGPIAPPRPTAQTRIVMKEGVFPYGMVIPMTFGPRRESLFEEALRMHRDIVIFYPRQGYGEMQVRKVCPLSIFRKGGVHFMEAYCDDTKEGEVFDLGKVRAVLRHA
ncbi:MAG TPA: helicase-associated domain-containing protein [Deltaproteobacteria bacterium]|nr:helicase-associated domain-containing protein [Deltaproteobacteria bacterium]HOM28892.1 helicase-associated domain-containing protein [Deltaproteobacteria bacterium]